MNHLILLHILNLVIVAQTINKEKALKRESRKYKGTSTGTWIGCQNFVFLDQILTDHSTFWRICFYRI